MKPCCSAIMQRLVLLRVGVISIIAILMLPMCALADARFESKSNDPKQGPVPDMLFLCRDQGADVFTNTQINKTCKGVRLGSPLVAKPTSAKPEVGSGVQNSAAANFPKVSAATQQARDLDRRKILNDELAAEVKSLDQAKRELAAQEGKVLGEEKNYKVVVDRLQPQRDKIAVHDRNIQALRKELAGLK